MGRFESDALVNISSEIRIGGSLDDIYPLLEKEKEAIPIAYRKEDKVYGSKIAYNKIEIDGVKENKNLVMAIIN